jgi:hypothetical protein
MATAVLDLSIRTRFRQKGDGISQCWFWDISTGLSLHKDIDGPWTSESFGLTTTPRSTVVFRAFGAI